VLENGTHVTKKPLIDFINANQTEVSSIYKLTKEHLDCQGPLRQKVSLAAQLLSHSRYVICFDFL
jgi:hypothetical protein